VSNVDVVEALTARKSHQNIKQGSFETLAQYSARFYDTYMAYKATGTKYPASRSSRKVVGFRLLSRLLSYIESRKIFNLQNKHGE